MTPDECAEWVRLMFNHGEYTPRYRELAAKANAENMANPEYRAAIAQCAKDLAAEVDRRIAEDIYRDVYGKL